MTDPRLNHRAPRGRDGRARGERRESDRAMAIWAAWWLERRERGWPAMAVEGRLMEYGPTRATTPPGPHVPDIDRARYGPKVNRLLADMEAEGLSQEAQVMRMCALHKHGQAGVALDLGVSRRTVIRRHLRGRAWMDEQLRLVPLEVRQSGERSHENGFTWNNSPVTEYFGVNSAS